jgi:hypothetical protein
VTLLRWWLGLASVLVAVSAPAAEPVPFTFKLKQAAPAANGWEEAGHDFKVFNYCGSSPRTAARANAASARRLAAENSRR